MPIESILLICGDRNWKTPLPIYALSEKQPGDGRTIVITGGAAGADTMGRDAAVLHGHRSIEIRAPWGAYGKLAGPLRNRWMLELLKLLKLNCPSAAAEVHAFHANLASSKGTADMIRRTREAGVTLVLHTDPEEA